VEIHRHLEDAEGEEIAALRRLRTERDARAVAAALGAVRLAACGTTNLMPALVEAVKVYATIGEICGVLREVFGEYRAPQVY
jgi:methylmalonyl-CoA mutase N-terminal domain/subunit